MGFPPPPNAPSVGVQQALGVSQSFATPEIDLPCNIQIPSFHFKIGFGFLIDLLFPLPFFFFSIGFNCDLENPISVKAGVAWGGGRVPNSDPDPDLLLDSQT